MSRQDESSQSITTGHAPRRALPHGQRLRHAGVRQHGRRVARRAPARDDHSGRHVDRASSIIRARAKRVIFLFMNGGLSQVDSFDPKPMLDKYHGQPLPGGTSRPSARPAR